jgi:hypothetical protein
MLTSHSSREIVDTYKLFNQRLYLDVVTHDLFRSAVRLPVLYVLLRCQALFSQGDEFFFVCIECVGRMLGEGFKY